MAFEMDGMSAMIRKLTAERDQARAENERMRAARDGLDAILSNPARQELHEPEVKALELAKRSLADSVAEIAKLRAENEELQKENRSLKARCAVPPWLSDAAEALGETRPEDGAPLAMNWSQVLHAIRELRAENENYDLICDGATPYSMGMSNAIKTARRGGGVVTPDSRIADLATYYGLTYQEADDLAYLSGEIDHELIETIVAELALSGVHATWHWGELSGSHGPEVVACLRVTP